MKIKNISLTAVLAAAGLLTAASAASAAVGGMHDNSNFWEGVYAGVDLGFAKPSLSNHWISGSYVLDGTDADLSTPRNRIDSVGATLGFNAGFSYVKKNMFFGKDWMWGIEGSYMPTQVRNKTLYNGELGLSGSEHAIYELNSIASARARLGVILDNMVVVGSAGMSLVDSRFGASTSDSAGDGDSGEFIDFNRASPVLGIGTIYKISDDFSFKVMVDHHFLYQKRSTTHLGDGYRADQIPGQESYARQNGLTTAYMGLSYHFG